MSAGDRPKRGSLRWLGRKGLNVATAYPRGLWMATNPQAITEEAANIRRLWGILRSPRPAGVAIVSGPGGRIDVPLTAEIGGVTTAQVERMLALRLRRTTTTFWTCVVVGAGGFLSWVLAALVSPPNFAGVWSGMMTLVLTLALGTKALEAALQNWQVRVRRLGSVGDFLRNADTMIPRKSVASSDD